jgi:hypothetical protein
VGWAVLVALINKYEYEMYMPSSATKKKCEFLEFLVEFH